jgi:mannose-6-phosphate isomerase-like protein (cupin superfamily)
MDDTALSEGLAARFLCAPAEPFSPVDEVFRFAQLSSFDDGAGQSGYVLEGQQYNFEALSVIVSEIRPGSGPPLHTHACEQVHIVLDGTATYVLGDQRVTVAGPYVVKIPAGVLHTFVNIGDQPLRLVAAFPAKQLSWEECGPNPLREER